MRPILLLLLHVNYCHFKSFSAELAAAERLLINSQSHTGIKVTFEQTAKQLLFLSPSFLGSQRVNGGNWARGESLKHILQQPMNSTLGPCIPERKLWFGREWRQPVAWPWFTGALRLPRVTNHNIMALWNQSKAQFQRMGERKERKSRERVLCKMTHLISESLWG